MRKRKLKESEKIGYAVSYTLTTAFLEQNHRKPNEEELNLIRLKSIKYVFDILDAMK